MCASGGKFHPTELYKKHFGDTDNNSHKEMKVHVVTPYAIDKNLGKAYNEAFERCPEDDWLCITDYDVLFLTPNSIKILHQYAATFPKVGLFTCLTNRIHPLAKNQLALPEPSENDSIKYWTRCASDMEHFFPRYTEVTKEVSGFLMMISKRTWNEVKFRETGECLGVDNAYCWDLISKGKSIYIMEALLVWHTYRINNIKDKSHLIP